MDTNISRFKELMDLLQLNDILLVHIESDRCADLPINAKKLKIEHRFQYIGEPSLNDEEKLISYQVKVILNLIDLSDPNEGCLVLKLVLGYVLSFSCSNIPQCNELLSDDSLKEVFIKVQIPKTLWPFIRQQYYDMANRHSMHVPPLPWLK